MKRKSKRVIKCIMTFVLTVAMVLGAVPLPFMPGSMVAHAEGASIFGEPADGHYTLASQTYTMTEDVNTSGYIYVPSGITATIDLAGHTINRGLSDGSAVKDGMVIKVEGILTIKDSSGNDTGKITGGNNSSATGGGVYVDGGTLTMTGGTITGNKASIYEGGGVYIEGNDENKDGIIDGSFIMTGGKISNNTANTYGGGVYVYKGVFTMSGSASITGNKSGSDGGGVYVSNGRFNLNGGSITGNCCSSGKDGGGVYFNSQFTSSGCCFYISGNPVIKDNVKNGSLNNGVYTGGTVNNVYFNSGQYNEQKEFYVTDSLTDGAELYVNNKNLGAVVASGSSYALTDSDAEKFYSDSDSTLVGVVDGNQVKLKKQLTSENTAVTIGDNSAAYTGEVITPTITSVKLNTSTDLTSGTDYTLCYQKGDAESVTTIKDAGEYTVFIAGAGNYTGKVSGGTFTIIPKELTPSLAGSASKTYDGTTDAPTSGLSISFSGLAEGDSDKVSASIGSAAFGDANVGTDKNVTVSGLTLSGAAKDNYTLGSNTASGNVGTITAKPVTVTAADQTVELNGSIDASVSKATLTGAVDGHTLDSITLTASSTANATTAGTITPSSATIKTGNTDVTSNYNITYTSGTLTVSKADPNPETPTGLTATYGQTLADVSLTSDSNGAWAWDEPTTSVGNVGSNSFSATYTPTDTANYNTKIENLTVTVSKAANPAVVTSTATVTKGGNTVDLASNITLNGATGEVTYAINDEANGCTLNGSVLTSGDNTGSVIVNVSVAADDNYNALAATPITVTISDKGTQTITASDVTATFGETGKKVEATTNGNGAISYAVKDGSADYIDVNASTGALTIKKVGTATVVVTAAETDTYVQATKEVTVTVKHQTEANSNCIL